MLSCVQFLNKAARNRRVRQKIGAPDQTEGMICQKAVPENRRVEWMPERAQKRALAGGMGMVTFMSLALPRHPKYEEQLESRDQIPKRYCAFLPTLA
jgi:hypothetical protein